MTGEIVFVFVFALTLVALVMFASERVRIDATSVLVMTVLMLAGILSPGEALQGFSNVATVTVGAMFVLSSGLRHTGALSAVGDRLGRMGRQNRWLALRTMMAVAGVVSGFINNTAAVAIFIPVVVGLGRDINMSPSKLLIPLSFASMFGGISTLIGTSTNLLVNSIAIEHGFAPFGMFELTPLGVILFAVGFAYLFASVRFIPGRRAGTGQDLTERFRMAGFITQVELGCDAADGRRQRPRPEPGPRDSRRRARRTGALGRGPWRPSRARRQAARPSGRAGGGTAAHV